MLCYFGLFLDMLCEHVVDIIFNGLRHNLGQDVEHLDVDKGWKALENFFKIK